MAKHIISGTMNFEYQEDLYDPYNSEDFKGIGVLDGNRIELNITSKNVNISGKCRVTIIIEQER